MKLSKHSNFLLGLPSFVWLVIFYAIPVVLVLFIAFKPVDSFGGLGDGWTLETIRNLGKPSYPAIIWRTFWQGVVATLACILIAVPVSYQLCRMESKLKNLFLLLIIVPFWTNFLIRIFAWKIFLQSNGIFHRMLEWCGILEPTTNLLYNEWAVLTVMIYTYIPFAVLPIYAVAEKFDYSLLDAAKDLGATSFYAFRRVYLPGISKGIWTAVMVVLIPAFGAYLIPSLVGGPTSELLGDKIAQSVFTNRNLPHASALSALLMLAVFLPMIAIYWIKKVQDAKAAQKNNRKDVAVK
ncbi:MAG: ABC transporter permease [Lentisphaeria bacterium]|nr:ABC transporter permease [Lentisphaeria bacterium]